MCLARVVGRGGGEGEFAEPETCFGVVELHVCVFFVVEAEALAVAAGLVGTFAVAAGGGEVFPEEVNDAAEDEEAEDGCDGYSSAGNVVAVVCG